VNPDAAFGRRPSSLVNDMNTVEHDQAAVEQQAGERVKPRLLNMRQAAAYLGCSFWTARDYILQGLIPVVDLPPLRARAGDRQRRTLRRVLVDRADLDAFVDSRKRTDRHRLI